MCTPETLRYSGYMLVSWGVPVDPLKPGAAPGQDLLSGGVPRHPQDEFLHPKGAAAKPPPPFGLHILLGSALGHPLKVGADPGQHKV